MWSSAPSNDLHTYFDIEFTKDCFYSHSASQQYLSGKKIFQMITLRGFQWTYVRKMSICLSHWTESNRLKAEPKFWPSESLSTFLMLHWSPKTSFGEKNPIWNEPAIRFSFFFQIPRILVLSYPKRRANNIFMQEWKKCIQLNSLISNIHSEWLYEPCKLNLVHLSFASTNSILCFDSEKNVDIFRAIPFFPVHMFSLSIRFHHIRFARFAWSLVCVDVDRYWHF